MLITRSQRGFTIVELMLAVAVLALILALGVPSLAEMVRTTQVRSLGESLSAGLQRARAEAIGRNRTAGFWLVTPAVGVPDASCALSSGSGSWVVALDNPAGKCNVAPSDTTEPRIVQLAGATAQNITVSAVAADGSGASSVVFNGFGQPVAGSASIARINIDHVESGARRLRLEISTSGAVRMCDRDVAAPDTRACLQ